MLDFDLAEIYGYTTKAFNQQVKNNEERFDEDFRFKLTREEVENLRCKNFTSKIGNYTEKKFLDGRKRKTWLIWLCGGKYNEYNFRINAVNKKEG